MKTNKKSIPGIILSGLVILFMLFDSLMKFSGMDVVDETMSQLGYPLHHTTTIGMLALVVTILYAIPRTALIGAILMTGYLGGAISTHLRVDNPLFSHTLFPIYIAVLMWGGLILRYPSVKSFLLNKH